jgi:6-phosphogluconolactonase
MRACWAFRRSSNPRQDPVHSALVSASAAVSSYSLNANDTLTVISAAVPNGQAASCWITLPRDGRFAFVSDTGTGTLSSYEVKDDGSVDLVQAVAAKVNNGGAPIDSAFSSDADFLYVVDSALGRIVAYQVKPRANEDDAPGLSLLSITPLPDKTSQGIAAQ